MSGERETTKTEDPVWAAWKAAGFHGRRALTLRGLAVKAEASARYCRWHRPEAAPLYAADASRFRRRAAEEVELAENDHEPPLPEEVLSQVG